MKKITIKDLAEIFHISPHTVSKALNNRPGVSEELRKKIQAKAKELHYVPNIFGRGLSGKSSRTIGVILSDNTNPAYSLIIRGIEQRASEGGYSIILGNSDEDLATEQRLITLLVEKHVDGALIVPANFPESAHNIKLFQQHSIPYILMTGDIPGQKYPCVKANNVLAAYLAGEYLLQTGHETIIHLSRKQAVPVAEERIRGLKDVFAEHQFHFPDDNLYRQCEVSIESGYTEMLSILKERRDFTAVLAYNDTVAFGVMMALHECGVCIPRDVAVVGFDNLTFSQAALVPLTTVDQHLYMLGATAIECLLNILNGHRDPPCPAMPAPTVVKRQSV